MSYVVFLTKLLALGPKLPLIVDAWSAVIAAITAAIKVTQEAFPVGELSGITGTLTPLPLVAPPSEEEMNLEDQLQSAYLSALPANALVANKLDGSRLRLLFQLLQALPQLKTMFDAFAKS
jgi:hypothetical protein